MKKSYLFLSVFYFLMIMPLAAIAATSEGEGWSILGGVDCVTNGSCNLCDITEIAIKLSNQLIALSGAIALVMVVYGGYLWLMSAGNTELISKGKSVLTNTFLALAVIFLSWMIVHTIILVLASTGGTTATIQDSLLKAWWNPSICK